MSLQLQIIAGPEAGKTYTVQPGGDLFLGRSQTAYYRLTDPRVSRSHCQILLEGDQAVVIDNGGSGGTKVNGSPVDRKTLKLGDVVQVGDTQLRLVMGDFPLDVAMGAVNQAGPGAAAAAPAVESLESLVNQTLSHYEIGPIIGKGRSSMVFHATDTKDDRPVAFKVLLPEFAKVEDEVQRFIRAVKTMLPLRHENLVTLYGAGKTRDFCWVAMEYVAGENLHQVIDRIGVAGMLDWKYAYRVGLHMARVLEYAHGEGIVHRNVTPTNILVDATNKNTKLGDLMLAKALEGALAEQITRPGELVGDVDYMSPERTRGTTDLDERADLYGLGATLYALLTGRPPCEGKTLVEKITRIRQVVPEKPTKAQMSIPGLFEGVVMKLLEKDPAARYQTAQDLRKELDRVGRFTGAGA